MEAIERLKAQAKARLDAAVRAAELDYAAACREIRAIERRLARDSPRPKSKKRLRQDSAVSLAEKILLEKGPLTLIELAVEVRARGYRSDGEPRKLVENLRAAMKYHSKRF